MDQIRYGLEHVLQELPRRAPVGLLDELGDRKLAGAVNAHEEVELAFSSLYLGDVPSRQIASQSPAGQWMWKNPIG